VDGTGFVVATDSGGLKAIHALAEPFEELVEEELIGKQPEPRRLSATRH
jgi:hypothetical protein